MTLYELTKQQSEIEAALTENGGELTPELELLWQETADSLPTKVDDYNAVLRKMQSQSEACSAEIKRLQAFKKVCDNSTKRIMEHVARCMEDFGIDRLDGQLCKMSLRHTQAIDVDEDIALTPFNDEVERLRASLPPYVTVTMGINKTAVKDYVKETPDLMPMGCIRVTNTSLIIK